MFFTRLVSTVALLLLAAFPRVCIADAGDIAVVVCVDIVQDEKGKVLAEWSLPGTLNDKKLMTRLAENFGFQVRCPKTTRRADITDLIKDVAAKARPENRILVYFSCHGVLNPKIGLQCTDSVLTFEQLQSLANRLRAQTPQVFWIFDACCAHLIGKGSNGEKIKMMPRQGQSLLSRKIETIIPELGGIVLDATQSRAAEMELPERSDLQVSAYTLGLYRNALAANGNGFDYRWIDARLTDFLPDDNPPLTRLADSRALFLHRHQSAHRVFVRKIQGNEIVLSEGIFAGLTPNTRIALRQGAAWIRRVDEFAATAVLEAGAAAKQGDTVQIGAPRRVSFRVAARGKEPAANSDADSRLVLVLDREFNRQFPHATDAERAEWIRRLMRAKLAPALASALEAAEPLAVELTSSKPVYVLGDHLSYTLKAADTRFVCLFQVGAEGDAALLLPNKHQDFSQTSLPIGKPIDVPDPAFPSYFFPAEPPPGTDLVIAIGCNRPFDVNHLIATGDIRFTDNRQDNSARWGIALIAVTLEKSEFHFATFRLSLAQRQ